MKKNFISIILFLIFTTQTFSHVGHLEKSSILEYELFRNNKLIGYHKYDFLRKGVYTYQSMITNLNICRKFKFDFKDLDLILSTR